MPRHTTGSGKASRWLTYTACAVALTTAFGGCGDNGKSPTGPSEPRFAAGTSSLSVNLDQCANDPRTANCSWQNGDLNGNNSVYAEGLVIPFRLAIEGLSAGSHTIHLNYDFTAGGHEGDDFLATYNATEMVDVCATGGGGVSSLCSSLPAPSTFAFPSDPFVVPGTQGNLTVAGAQSSSIFNVNNKRFLTIWGGTITAITAPSHSGPTGGNSSADITVTFSSSGSAVLLAWGAHLAQSSYWKNSDGTPDGAGEISGAPWHMRTQSLDGSGGNKNQDRSIQPSALIHPPQVTLTKTADAATVNAGDAIGFTITASNTGAGDATSFVLSDPLPTGVGITWSIASQSGSPACVISSGTLLCPSSGTGTLAAGATLTIHITSPTTSGSCGTYQNTATVSFSTATGGTVPPPAQASVTVNCASIGLTKTADASPVNAGDQIGFTITASNSGTGTATGVTVTDTLPSNSGLSWSISPAVSGCSISSGVLTCNFGSMATGASASVHVISSTTFASCATISNRAHVATSNDGSAQASAQVVVNCPSLTVTKTADASPVDAGSNIGFTIQVSNGGAGTAKSVTLSDALPTGTGISWGISPAYAGPGSCSITSNTLSCSFGDLAASASASVHVQSATTSASCKKYVNTATAQATNHAQVTGKDSATVQCPSLRIDKSPASQTKSAGEAFSWTVTLTNDGPGTALGATISDPLPVVTGVSYTLDSSSPSGANCAISSGSLNCGPLDLAAGSSITAVINATTSANQGCVSGGFKNIATGAATGVSSVKDTASVTLQCPNLTITKTPDNGTIAAGGTATFTIVVSNTGAGKAYSVALSDQLLNTLSWSVGSSTGWDSCSISSSQLLSCSAATMNASGSATVTVSATVPSSFVFQTPVATGTSVAMDGNLVVDPNSDWASLPTNTNGGVLKCENPIVGCALDPSGKTDNSFGQGTKEDTPVPTIVSGAIPPNKSDLTRFYITYNRRTVSSAVHDFVYLAWERVQNPSGTTNMDFEFNQSSTMSSNGVTPVRTPGDILIKYDLSSGGDNLSMGYHVWVTSGACEASGSASVASPCWGPLHSLAGAFQGAANATGTVDDPINPNATRTLDILTFGEASIDLQAAGIFTAGQCTSFGRAYLKSRSSDSFTAAIKDFVAPIPVSITNCQPATIPNTASVSATNVSAISDNGQITVTVP